MVRFFAYSTKVLLSFIASSWHGNDAAIVKWIYRHRILIMLSLTGLLLIILAVIRSIQYVGEIMDPLKKIRSTAQSNIYRTPIHYKRFRLEIFRI